MTVFRVYIWQTSPLKKMLFWLFRATPAAYGGSQARGWIGATVASLCHRPATPDLSHVCYLHHSSWQCQILNPLNEARDRTCVLMDVSQICFCWAMTGTPHKNYFKNLASFKMRISDCHPLKLILSLHCVLWQNIKFIKQLWQWLYQKSLMYNLIEWYWECYFLFL